MSNKDEMQARPNLQHDHHKSIHPITQANQNNSPLLRLPGEVRSMIYPYVFDTVIVRPRTTHFDSVDVDISLLLTCRQTYYEARHHASTLRKTYFHIFVDGVIGFRAITHTVWRDRCARSQSITMGRRLAVLLSADDEPSWRWSWEFHVAKEFTGLRYVTVTRVRVGEQQMRERMEKALRVCFGKEGLSVRFA
jgi:hypothetical protein